MFIVRKFPNIQAFERSEAIDFTAVSLSEESSYIVLCKGQFYRACCDHPQLVSLYKQLTHRIDLLE